MRSDPNSAAPKVSVLIATSGQAPRFVEDVLETVCRQARALGGEVVVVVNRARGEVPELEALADQLIFEARPGKSNALNTGIERCRAAIVAFTDDDTQPEGDWLAELVAPLLDPATPARVVGVGGPVEPIFSDDTPDWFRNLVDRKTTHFLGPKHVFPPDEKEYAYPDGLNAPLGANCAYRRRLFDTVCFSPRLGPNYETGLRGGDDTLLGRQALATGDRILFRPSAIVRHPVDGRRMTYEYVLRGYYVHGVERVRLMRELGQPLPSPAQARHQLWAAQWRHLRSIGRPPFKRLRKRFRVAFERGVLDELTGRYRPR